MKKFKLLVVAVLVSLSARGQYWLPGLNNMFYPNYEGPGNGVVIDPANFSPVSSEPLGWDGFQNVQNADIYYVGNLTTDIGSLMVIYWAGTWSDLGNGTVQMNFSTPQFPGAVSVYHVSGNPYGFGFLNDGTPFTGAFESKYYENGYEVGSTQGQSTQLIDPPGADHPFFGYSVGDTYTFQNGQTFVTLCNERVWQWPAGFTGSWGCGNIVNGVLASTTAGGNTIPMNGCFNGVEYLHGQPVGPCADGEPLNGCIDGIMYVDDVVVGFCDPEPPPPPPTDCPPGYTWDGNNCVPDGSGGNGGGGGSGDGSGNAYFQGNYNFSLDWLPESWAIAVAKGSADYWGKSNVVTNAAARASNALDRIERRLRSASGNITTNDDETAAGIEAQTSNLVAEAFAPYTNALAGLTVLTNVNGEIMVSVLSNMTTNVFATVSNLQFAAINLLNQILEGGPDTISLNGEVDIGFTKFNLELGVIDFDQMDQKVGGWFTTVRGISRVLVWFFGLGTIVSTVRINLSGVDDE